MGIVGGIGGQAHAQEGGLRTNPKSSVGRQQQNASVQPDPPIHLVNKIGQYQT
jgi:hypothetical protein